MGADGADGNGGGRLFETRVARGRRAYKLYAGSVFAGVCLIWVYRATHIPGEGEGRWAWLGLLAADIWFGLYWVVTQSVRWRPIYRRTFKDRLSQRYEKDLPGVDVFVCTADRTIEPPEMVVSTVLSVMAYDYPAEKLSVYLSDDGGSDLTFYALLEASRFARVWIPFCKQLQLEPRSPAAYFAGASEPPAESVAEEWWAVQKLYIEMENKIEAATKLGRIPEDFRREHKGFLEWTSKTTSRNHAPIVQILIDGRYPNALDGEGNVLPTLVYMAREKRPHRHHNFKAGAMNSLIRVSSEISNGQIILNVDCDMYSNNSKSVRDALCFFMDEKKGHEIAYVQFPQKFNNIMKNDVYGNALRVIFEVDFPGMDGFGGPLYAGSGCFHRRCSLTGNKYREDHKEIWKGGGNQDIKASTLVLEERAKDLATCTYEDNTQWGKDQMGLKYGCPVEDVLTGLTIKCRGWKSVYFNPTREGFLGVAPLTLAQTLVQNKRWSEGDFQIFLSKYCPFLHGHGTIQVGLQLAYNIYCLWAPNSLPTLYYAIVPSLSILQNVHLFPKISSVWSIPFVYVIIASYAYSLWESLHIGFTFKGWLNEQRMWLLKRSTSYLFAFFDTLIKQLGLDKSTFIVTAKVADEDVTDRYKKEVMEFGSSSPMFIILATLALLNLLCLVGGVKMLMDDGFEEIYLQFLISCQLVIVNIPLYHAMFFRKDNGRMPTTVTFTSLSLAVFVCLVALL